MTGAISTDQREALDQAAFERFFADTCHLVVGLVTVATGDVAAAEDAAQEAYLRAHQRWHRVARMERPDLWVAHVATRIAISSWRRHRRETALGTGLTAEVADNVTQLWTRWGLEALSPMQRMTMILHHVDGRPVEEVAAMAGTSRETVRTHLKRGRLRLRRLLSQRSDHE